jgi:hypothetical protein
LLNGRSAHLTFHWETSIRLRNLALSGSFWVF